MYHNGTPSVALSERQPIEFGDYFTYKKNGVFLYKIDVLVVLVSAVTDLALQNFTQTLPAYYFWSQTAGLELKFRSTVVKGDQKYQCKTVMWAMRDLSCFLNAHDRWAEVSFMSKYDGQPELGFGQLNSKPLNTQATESSLHAVEATDGAIQPVKPRALKDTDIRIADFQVVKTGHVFAPFDIYSLILNILIEEAQLELNDYTTAVTAYSPVGDLSISIGATSVAAAPLFTNRFAILALDDLSDQLSQVREREFKWKECIFLIRDNGAIVGRGAVRKGRLGAAEMLDGVGNTEAGGPAITVT